MKHLDLILESYEGREFLYELLVVRGRFFEVTSLTGDDLVRHEARRSFLKPLYDEIMRIGPKLLVTMYEEDRIRKENRDGPRLYED